MKQIVPFVVLFSLMLFGEECSASAGTGDLVATFPDVPSDYETLEPGVLLAKAQVNFPAYYVGYTTGYRVTAPDGTEFVVDNIDEPKCAVYGTYVNTGGTIDSTLGEKLEINSKVYINEVNFENCQ
jgi:hypothetical protein